MYSNWKIAWQAGVTFIKGYLFILQLWWGLCWYTRGQLVRWSHHSQSLLGRSSLNLAALCLLKGHLSGKQRTILHWGGTKLDPFWLPCIIPAFCELKLLVRQWRLHCFRRGLFLYQLYKNFLRTVSSLGFWEPRSNTPHPPHLFLEAVLYTADIQNS